MNIVKHCRVAPGTHVRLDDALATETFGVSKEDAEARIVENADAISELQHTLYAEHTRSMLVVLQAMDAGGKDSTIRGVFNRTNPQAVHAKSFKKPTEEELSHDFLWRIHRVTPSKGHIGVFNRSHYEDVLIVRVENLVPESVWSARYEAINRFEGHLAANGMHIIKIFLHVSKARQREKLIRRITDPRRAWKFEPADFETRKKWDRYMEAYEDAITRCSTEDAPWFIVPSDRKWARLLAVSEIVRAGLEAMAPRIPEPRISPGAALRLVDQLE